jgi:HAD superfamily hydrolase (TIGR01509 family)
MVKAVAFDFNGIIVDDEHLHFEAFRLALEPSGVELTHDDYWAHYLALDDPGVIRVLREDYPAELASISDAALLAVKIEHYLGLVGAKAPLFPGAVEAVRALANELPMVIVSGARRVEIETALEQAGIANCFQGIVAAEDTERGKPDPAPYLMGAQLLRRPPGQIVAIEDSIGGIASARAAGLRVIAVAQTYPRERLTDADLVLDRIADLDPVVLRRFR